MGTRRKFSAEFKREAVVLTAQPDASVAEVARELGIRRKSFPRRRRRYRSRGYSRPRVS